VAAVSYQQDALALAVVFLGLVVDPGHQRAHGVNDPQVAEFGPLEVLRWGAVGREYDQGAVGHLIHLFHGDGALALEFCHDIGVVDDLVLYVDGWAEAFEAELNHFDGADDAGAESSGATEYDFNHGTPLWVLDGPTSPLSLDGREPG
jgi:hypothetical protein